MKMPCAKIRKLAFAAGFIMTSQSLWAGVHSLPLPPPSAYVDTESSTNVVFSGWNDLTRFVKIHAEVFASLASCVQVAIGTDRSNDGALAVEETDLVLGYDCGTWFIRDERNGREWTEDVSNLLSGDFVQQVFMALAAPRYDGVHQENGMVFSREWNLMKVTTRGAQALAPTFGLEFKNNPLVFILK